MGTISNHLSRQLTPPASCVRACVDRPRRVHVPPHAEEMAALRASLWEPGTTLRIAFHGGRVADRVAVMLAASIWEQYANVRFVQVTSGPAEVRCAFDPGGSWSYIGREILQIGPDLPTMNMGWPDDAGRDLHELGHTLGCIHEHQSPAAGIPWDKEAVYAFYGGAPNYWSRAEVDEQVFARYDASTITNTVWDKNSIMEYPVPAALVTDPSFAVGWNEHLSPQDVAFIQKLYPKD